MNFLKHLFTPAEFKQYQLTHYPFNIPMLRAALDSKLKEDPAYEVFVRLNYFKFEPMVRNGICGVEHPNVFISNKGTIVARSRTGFEPRVVGDVNGYPTFNIRLNKVKEQISLHRAVACIFVPLTDDLVQSHPKYLQANHIDGDKENFELGNIEWVTPQGNYDHAIETGLAEPQGFGLDNKNTLPVKGVVLKGINTGYEFVVRGGTEMIAFGFNPGNLNSAITGRAKTHKSCSWSYATPEEVLKLPVGVTDEIRETL